VPITRASTRLAAVLHGMNITQQELIERSGVSRQTVSNAYHGRAVSVETWIRLAETLGIAVQEIAPPKDAARIIAVT
jgi:transcriptional regulator with XRE-family HTH domain